MFRTLSLILTGVLSFSTQVGATTVCYPRDQMLSYIDRDFSATKQAVGILRPHSVMEVWVAEKNGDWLIVTTDLNGSSCIVAYGEEFSFSDLPKPVDNG